MTLPPRYTPAEHEPRIWQRWTSHPTRPFHAEPTRVDRAAKPNHAPGAKRPPYGIIIPPPNVTGRLHLGHALNNTLQDILIRAHRMMGFETVWMPGTDHAGIATQAVVEKRLLKEENKRKSDFTRDEFIARVQQWKDEYEAAITDQLKRMGCSCDYDRQRFTMDDICARAVREAFFRLFRDGLIYRGKRLVNWDPDLQTAVADDETESLDLDGFFYYLRYPLVHPTPSPSGGGLGRGVPVTWGELARAGYPSADEHDPNQQAWVTVATTRPETYLGDTAVALNPKDPRAAALVGKKVRLPLINREIPIIADDYVVMPSASSPSGRGQGEGSPASSAPSPESPSPTSEPEDPKAKFATGFLKVTPAHDPNDYDIGQRHGLPQINIMSPDGKISDQHGLSDIRGTPAELFLGLKLSTKESHQKVIAEFKKLGLFEKQVPYQHAVAHSQRSGAPIEPYLSDQWYCKVTDERMAPAANEALRTSQLEFHPARYSKTYETWHTNIRDWCISRQLWWGHQIPVWSLSKYFAPDPSLPPNLGRVPYPSTCSSPEEMHDFKRQFDLLGSQQRVSLISGVAKGIALTRWGDIPSELGQLDWGTVMACVRDESDQEAINFLERHGFNRDPDVLDTWFSSALWPSSTMGWPDPAAAAAIEPKNPDFAALLAAFNPSSVLCTAREIITLWVSRMVMFNRYLMPEGWPRPADLGESARGSGPVPFNDVFIHSVIQDGEGRKMSKSLGNGVDPLDIIDSHGADAMRFVLCHMTTQTQDVRLPVEKDPTSGKNTSPKFDLGRNFCTKLWNASRFAMMNMAPSPSGRGEGEGSPASSVSLASLPLIDRWMLSRVARTIAAANESLAEYQFSVYAQSLYDLMWRDFCDWYLEAIKPTVKASPAQQAVLRATLDSILRLLHPVMPFVTETIHESLREFPAGEIEGLALPLAELLVSAPWPIAAASLIDESAERDFGFIQELTDAVRTARSAKSVEQKRKITLHADQALIARLAAAPGTVELLAGLERITADAPPAERALFTFQAKEYALSNLADALDPSAERASLETQVSKLEKEIAALSDRLNNPGYAQKAPPKLVEESKAQLAQKEAERDAAKRRLVELG